MENAADARSMSEITLNFEREETGWKLSERHAESIAIKDYEPDPEAEALFAAYDARAKEYANAAAGAVTLAEDSVMYGPVLSETGKTRQEILEAQAQIPESAVTDDAITDMFSGIVQYYSGANITGFPTLVNQPDVTGGVLTRKGICQAEPYNNTIGLVEMNGAQLKEYMEWAAARYRTMEGETDVIAYDPEVKGHYVDVLQGVDYKVNLAKPAGERITDLEYKGRPVSEDDVFRVAVISFRIDNQFLSENGIFKGQKKPVLLDDQVREDLGGTQELALDYIENINASNIEISCDGNWELIYTP